MASGWANDGAVQDQIDAMVDDAVARIKSQIRQGESALECQECGKKIPQARRDAVPGVSLCIHCQMESDQQQTAFSGYNRRGSKDSQLR